jgi:hypothetical protein
LTGEPFGARGAFDFAAQDVTARIHELIPIMLKHRLTPPPQGTAHSHSHARRSQALNQCRMVITASPQNRIRYTGNYRGCSWCVPSCTPAWTAAQYSIRYTTTTTAARRARPELQPMLPIAFYFKCCTAWSIMRNLAELALELILANVVVCGDGKIANQTTRREGCGSGPHVYSVYIINNVRAGNTLFTSVHRYLMFLFS